jgi:hypothetical protein
MLQHQGGGLQQISYWARKLNLAERANTYYAYDLEALAVCKAVKHWMFYLVGCSKFLVVTYHDTLSSHATEQQAEHAVNTILAGLATVCGFDDTCISQGSHERSSPVKSATILRTLCHNSMILRWRGSVISRITTEVPSDVRRRVVNLNDG